jgi:hypothetical protein
MIFYRIRENKEACEILVRAKLNEKLFDLGSTSGNATVSGSELHAAIHRRTFDVC